jgi:hypothetical protein
MRNGIDPMEPFRHAHGVGIALLCAAFAPASFAPFALAGASQLGHRHRLIEFCNSAEDLAHQA